MRSARTIRSTGGRAGDEGFALITTVLVMALLAAFSLVVLQQTLSSTTLSKKDQDWVAALSAAQAGVDDYVSRINDTAGGYATWTTANPDPANPAMGFTGGAAKWAPVPTAGGEASRGSFHYDVDVTGFTGSSSVAPNGNVVVSSTGRVGARSRTVSATVRRSGFVDYVYYSDLETQDPLDVRRGVPGGRRRQLLELLRHAQLVLHGHRLQQRHAQRSCPLQRHDAGVRRRDLQGRGDHRVRPGHGQRRQGLPRRRLREHDGDDVPAAGGTADGQADRPALDQPRAEGRDRRRSLPPRLPLRRPDEDRRQGFAAARHESLDQDRDARVCEGLVTSPSPSTASSTWTSSRRRAPAT